MSLVGRRRLTLILVTLTAVTALVAAAVLSVTSNNGARLSSPSCPEGTPSGPPVRPPDAFFEEVEDHPEFAGIFHLSECFALVVMTTGDVATFHDIAKRHFAPNERFIVGRTTHTYRELQALQDEVVADREEWLAAGIDLQSVGVDPKLNRVEVGILELTDAARERLVDRYGDRIIVVQAGPWQELAGSD